MTAQFFEHLENDAYALTQVYHPSVLLTKKRYVGMMFESPGQQEPTFDAKGIETVRRDTCPAVAKTMERSLRILFASRDLSQVQASSGPVMQASLLPQLCPRCRASSLAYDLVCACIKPSFVAALQITSNMPCCILNAVPWPGLGPFLFNRPNTAGQVRTYMERQWDKILAGRVSVADFVFAKEVRLGTYSSKPGAVAPPAAIVAAHAMARDPRAEPRFAERIPYVVVYGAPGEGPGCSSLPRGSMSGGLELCCRWYMVHGATIWPQLVPDTAWSWAHCVDSPAIQLVAGRNFCLAAGDMQGPVLPYCAAQL